GGSMSQPRLKAGWHLLTADNGDIIVTAMTGGESRINRPIGPIRELLRRLAVGEPLSPYAAWLAGLSEDEARRRVEGWLEELAGLGIIEPDPEPLPEGWERYAGQMAFLSAAGAANDSGLAA